MNKHLSMSIGGSSNESEAERARKLARLVYLDLNYPPAGENATLGASSGVQPPQHSLDDECLIISPRKFEEAMNNSQRNPFRIVRSHEDFTEDRITLGISLGRLETANRMISLICEVLNKTNDTASSVPIAPTVTRSEAEAEAPVLSCVICMGELVEETSTKCGHIFCKTCIETAIATQHKCPNCRRKLRKRDIFRVHLPYNS